MKKYILAFIITACLCLTILFTAFGLFLRDARIRSQEQQKKQVTAETDIEATNNLDVIIKAPEDFVENNNPMLPEVSPEPDTITAPSETPSATPVPEDTVSIPITPEESSNAIITPEDTQTVPSVQNTANGHIVAIDAGHQRKGNSEKEPLGPGSSEMKAKVSSGTTGRYTNVAEYMVNLDVSLLLRDELVRRGYQVVMIRETHDVNISNSERAEIANTSGAEIFIRIHCNGVDDSSVNGALTMAPTAANPYVGYMASECDKLSQVIIDKYCEATGFKNLGIQHTDNMSGINWCKIPVTIVEMGFMTNAQDDAKLVDPYMQAKIAQGLANGVDSYFGL